MEQLPPNYNKIPRLSPSDLLNVNQLPLYGMVYNADEKEYEYTIAGEAVMMQSRPFWEEVIELREVHHSTEYVWLGIQRAAASTAF